MAGLIRNRLAARAPWGELSPGVYEAVGRELVEQGLLDAVPPWRSSIRRRPRKERPMSFPLPVKLILAICLPLVAVYLTILILDYRSSKQEALRHMENYLIEVAAHEATALDAKLSTYAEIARSTGQVLETFAPRKDADLERFAQANLLAEPQLFGFGMALEMPAEGKTQRVALRLPHR